MVTRRELLLLAGMGVTGYGGYRYSGEGIQRVKKIVGNNSENSSMDGKEFGMLSSGFKSISWIDTDLKILFEKDHSIDFISINQ